MATSFLVKKTNKKHKNKSKTLTKMIKQKSVDYKQTNVALIGSDADKEARYKAANSEESFKGAGQKVGLEVWRVENDPATDDHGPVFGVKRWGKPGSFYQGDSFIVMNTFQKPNDPKLYYDIHFWLGKESSQDEKGVAAYKTVELDDLLHQQGRQHREKQGHETDLFLSYFKPNVKIQEGGHSSGFHHVTHPDYKPQLLEVSSGRHPKVQPVPVVVTSLNEGEVFILDLGLTLIQWNGKNSHPLQKNKASEIGATLASDRGARHSVLDSGNDSSDDGTLFWKQFGGPQPVAETAPPATAAHTRKPLEIYVLNNRSGTMSVVKIDKPSKASLDHDNVCIVDVGVHLFVWVGKNATKEERLYCMRFADHYIEEHNRPDTLPVTRILDGNEPDEFWELWKETL